MNSVFFKKHNFVGRGISGQTTSEMLVRFRQDVINLHPKSVIILAGINDIAENNGAAPQKKHITAAKTEVFSKNII